MQARGALSNPANRFERIAYEPDPDVDPAEQPGRSTLFLRDSSRSLIVYNDSPDVGFSAGINPYRGCEHGCIYCYARPTHEYLGFSAGLDFETRILVKDQAPELLRSELTSSKWQPQVLGMSGVTDAFQPIERRLRLSRGCLEVLAEFGNPVTIVTKNHLVARDADLLSSLAARQAAAVFVSVTSLDAELAQVLEPRASRPAGRLAAIAELSAAGVPTGVMVAPIIPGLTDHEMPSILAAAADAGARFACYTMLRLPYAVADLFQDWLAKHFPDKKDRVLGRVRDTRDGKLNDPRFRKRMRGEGVFAQMVADVFRLSCKQHGLSSEGPELSVAAFRRPGGVQRLLFE